MDFAVEHRPIAIRKIKHGYALFAEGLVHGIPDYARNDIKCGHGFECAGLGVLPSQ
jgi:hypothetical protein